MVRMQICGRFKTAFPGLCLVMPVCAEQFQFIPNNSELCRVVPGYAELCQIVPSWDEGGSEKSK